ncbi:MAG TPA: hypothetical protein PK402_08565, partial [Tepidisphaeraceae bacterium]|nr:hypothetical protein [Tepidisphaeraceae bacterium]
MSLPNDDPVRTVEEVTNQPIERNRFLFDLITSYALAIVRVAGWIIVSGLLYRFYGSVLFALLAVMRTAMAPVAYAAFAIG